MPCFAKWIQNSGIISIIPTDVLKDIDAREFFDRPNGHTPFLILDCYSIRTELQFVENFRNSVLKWTVCIIMPHSASLWQVSDSSEQNGSLNMAITLINNKLAAMKDEISLNCKLTTTVIMMLINDAREKSFYKFNEKKSIRERS